MACTVVNKCNEFDSNCVTCKVLTWMQRGMNEAMLALAFACQSIIHLRSIFFILFSFLTALPLPNNY
ncbi:hypothetical protein E2C01_063125 [Portunus trituberculatus]|uniref:Uncharacterized protein n=1 Tax=Portunus trituberculatus TaxID=210409 RepID=A0A5B7HJZ1_PORTR|nr:hypothetical protein [Portunus trituberculatus]